MIRKEWPKPLAEISEPDRTVCVVEGLQALLSEEATDPEAAKDAAEILRLLLRIIDHRFSRAWTRSPRTPRPQAREPPRSSVAAGTNHPD